MADETKIENKEQVEQNPTNLDLIEKYKKLKETSVSKEKYDKVVGEYNELTRKIMDGEISSNKIEEKAPEIDVEKLRKDILHNPGQMSNLQTAESIVALRKELIRRNGEAADPFISVSIKDGMPTPEDVENANKVGTFLEEAIADANGSPSRFRAYLEEHLVGDTMPRRR